MIQLPEGLETIGEEAFRACYDLEALTIPTTVTSIPVPIVEHGDLTTVVLPKELTEIADMAFGEELRDVYCYRGSYAAQWAKEQAVSPALVVHYITDSTFANTVISGPDSWEKEYVVYDAGMEQSWMEGVSVGLMEPDAEYHFICTSSNPGVARVNGSVVEYLKPGKATLTITATGRTNVTPYTITKEVYKPVESFTVPDVMFAKLNNGWANAYAPITIEPADANPWFACGETGHSWSIGEKIENGKIWVEYSEEPLIRSITVTARSGVSKELLVVFYNRFDALDAFAPSRDLIVGEVFDPDITLTVDGSPIANLNTYTITSSNSHVAVGVDGKHVKAVGRGTATITVKEKTSGLTAKFTVKVDVRDALITPQFLTVIGPEAFAGIGAKEIILYDECTEIQSRAFASCANLTRIEIPASVTVIADDAFEGCSQELVIAAPSWSEARTFADANGFQWEELAQ